MPHAPVRVSAWLRKRPVCSLSMGPMLKDCCVCVNYKRMGQQLRIVAHTPILKARACVWWIKFQRPGRCLIDGFCCSTDRVVVLESSVARSPAAKSAK